MNQHKPYLTTLTPLRGTAALLVVIFHSNLDLIPFMPINNFRNKVRRNQGV